MKTNTDIINASIVPEHDRIDFLPRLFGSAFMSGEQAIYTTTDRYCAAYSGGYWEYVLLSNGGRFMYPRLDTPSVSYLSAFMGNEYHLTGEAVGIAACLMVLSSMSFSAHEEGKKNLSQLLARNFHLLRDFALDHPESEGIFAVID